MIIDVHVHPLPEEIVREFPAGLFELYKKIFNIDLYNPIPIERLVDDMDKLGIAKAFLLPIGPCSVNTSVTYGCSILNEIIANIVKRYPERFIGFACVDPRMGQRAANELERCVLQLGLRGLKLLPNLVGLDINDKLLYPVYSKAQELGIPLLVHTGSLFDQPTKIKHCRPILVDDVAVGFPELKIIMAHFGWPWVEEAVAVALRNENVYFDISGWLPRYLPNVLLTWMNYEPVYKKALFGTDYPLVDPQRAISEIHELPLKDKAKEDLLYNNALEFLKP